MLANSLGFGSKPNMCSTFLVNDLLNRLSELDFDAMTELSMIQGPHGKSTKLEDTKSKETIV